MANVNNPNGFTPIRNPYGPLLSVNRYYKDATAGAMGVGDEVVRVASSSDPEGGPEVVRATVGSYITGVVVGIEPIRSNLGQVGYLSATDVGYVLVADDPNQEFEVMEAGSGTALAVTDVGKHIDSITAATPNTTRGRSVMALDNNAKATDNTWIIRRLSTRPGNAVGAYARWIVSANLHTEANAGASDKKEL